MSLNVQFQQILTVVQTYDGTAIPSAGAGAGYTVVHSAFNQAVNANSASTPPVTKRYSDELTGSQSLDLTALADPADGAVDATGLKLQYLLVVNLSTTHAVTLADALANQYALNGGDDLVIPIGGSLLMAFNDQLADVAAGAKAIEITAQAGESYQLMMVFG